MEHCACYVRVFFGQLDCVAGFFLGDWLGLDIFARVLLGRGERREWGEVREGCFDTFSFTALASHGDWRQTISLWTWNWYS